MSETTWRLAIGARDLAEYEPPPTMMLLPALEDGRSPTAAELNAGVDVSHPDLWQVTARWLRH